MEKHQVETLKAISKIKELAENGKIQEAISEIINTEPSLNKKERCAMMNVYSNAVVNYSIKT